MCLAVLLLLAAVVVLDILQEQVDNLAAQVAVQESIKDSEYLLGTVKKIIEERARLFVKLQGLDFLKPVPSQANFILCEVVRGDAKQLQDDLEKIGILIRYYNTPLLKNYIRISAGKPEQTDKIIAALKKVGGKANG